MKKFTIAIIVSLLSVVTSNAQIVINELMQSNVDCVIDDLNEFPDSWVELYNAGSESVSLKGYYLGITDNSDEAWALPSQTIASGGYALVYCDEAATKMHTDFRLESGKNCQVWLFKGSEVIDSVTGLQKQPAPNIAYGRKDDGGEEWGYQLKPTPGKSNTGEITDYILGNPIFSEPGRVITQGSSLTLSLSVPEDSPRGTLIRYTLDGSEPTKSSSLYMEPIEITGTTVVRAKLFCDEWLSPRSVTQSYIFFPREMTLPVLSISANDNYFNDAKFGIYVDGNYQPGKQNYKFNWRRPMNVEFFDGADAESAINQLCEGRIMGGSSRKYTPRSMIIYANKRFGTKHFNYEFFPDQKPGLDEQKSILLRNSGGDCYYLYMRDAIIQRVMGTYTDLDWEPWRPTILYINGSYKGIINIRERSTSHYVWANFDKLEDIDMIENWEQVKEGDTKNYEAFKKFYSQRGHTREEYEKWMDCVEYINLMIMNLYFGNMDFPGNNSVMWRPRTEDGRWRFIAKDADWGLGLNQEYYPSLSNRCPAYVNSIDWFNNYTEGDYWVKKPEYTVLFRYMMEDPELNREFVDRCSIYMGDFLNEKGVREIWDPMYETIKAEYPYHRALVKDTWLNYDAELASARQWLSERTYYFYKHMASTYRQGSPIPMTVNKNVEEAQALNLRFNGIKLSKGVFDGQFYRDHIVTLEAEAPEGKEIKGWHVTITNDNGTTEEFFDGEVCSFTMPKCTSLNVEIEMTIIDDGIMTFKSSDWKWRKDDRNVVLSSVPIGTKVQLYDMRGILLQSVVSEGTALTLPLSSSQFYILKVGDKTLKF